jgi:hypothetical protein
VPAFALDMSDIVVCQSAMKLNAGGQFAFYILELLSSYAEGVHVARNLIGRAHSFEYYAVPA